MTAQELYDKLRPFQESKGNFFNADMTMTLDLLASLLTNKERYGYMDGRRIDRVLLRPGSGQGLELGQEG